LFERAVPRECFGAVLYGVDDANSRVSIGRSDTKVSS
jgi:hypothetical protein